ncbi:MAG TPA: hypothetical protein PK082_11455 [Phycisphaerae bacterium]|nr:hypothetical protein [Phycisphaerae bacterium]
MPNVTVEKVGEIDLRDFGEIGIRCGDVNGDGKTELIIPQMSDAPVRKASAGGYPHEKTVHCITVLDLEGNVLWQKGTPIGEAARKHHGPGAFVVHDFDADGRDEIIYATQRDNLVFVRRLRGTDGECLAERETGATYVAMPANLRGLGSRRDVVIGTGLSLVFAYDENIEPIWEWAYFYGGGHEHAAADVEGKGVDDLFIGVSRLDAQGNRIWWRPDLDDAMEGMRRCPHIDHVVVEELRPGSGEYQVLWFGGKDIVCLDAISGKLLWRFRGTHLQEGTIGRFDPSRDDKQICLFDKEEPGNPSYMLTSDGELLWKKPFGRTSLLAGAGPDGRDLLLAKKAFCGEPPFVGDHNGNCLATFPLPAAAPGPGDRGFGWCARSLPADDKGTRQVLVYNRSRLFRFALIAK